MARPLRLTYEGAVYHVTARGIERGRLFQVDQDRERYLFYLAESLQLYDVRLYLFCLMTNHVHLVLETPRGNISQFMQRFHTAECFVTSRMMGNLAVPVGQMQGRERSPAFWQGEYL